ncbi:MAG: vioA [Candidatus Saccharibacteria bacterium]|nr:vioA [Candidatus Saccharibacteria bacterium]
MDRINVTKSFLPPMAEYQAYLARIWDADQLTNQGPLLQEFETKTSNYLGLDNFHFVSNGTIALQVALQALDITEGEVITTPFSYVATTSTILWQRCDPVFVDINPDNFCMDVTKIEAAITEKTRAIMPVHVFGFPCEVEKIEAIAKKHGLKVIYDAAHAFGVKYHGKSLLDYGDISTCSFHATKLFHTIEGGCIVAPDDAVSDKVELIKRFGHNGDEHFMLGINAKASEFQAAMGLCNLKYIDGNIAKRKVIFEKYSQLLNASFQKLALNDPNVDYNYMYYPVVLKDEPTLLKVVAALNEQNIFPRRYFYPSLNKLPYLDSNQSCPVSESISSRIICLPLYVGLELEQVERIANVMNNSL